MSNAMSEQLRRDLDVMLGPHIEYFEIRAVSPNVYFHVGTSRLGGFRFDRRPEQERNLSHRLDTELSDALK